MVFGVKKWEKEHTKVFVITHIVKTNIFLG